MHSYNKKPFLNLDLVLGTKYWSCALGLCVYEESVHVFRISATLCEENIMFWEVSVIGSEVIGLLWNLSFLEYSIGLFFLGLFLAFIVLLFSSPLGHSLFLTLIPDCCLCLQIHRCINFISSWVYDHTIAIPVLIVPMSQDGSTRSDLPADGQEELGGFSQSERMVAAMMKMVANLTMQKQQLLQQHLQLDRAANRRCGRQPRATTADGGRRWWSRTRVRWRSKWTRRR